MGNAHSPYLQYHKNSPIFWQEWSAELITYARNNDKLLFVSVGYATCTWCCHMIETTFNDQNVATFLNEHCVALCIDRDQRPDIDAYLMGYAIEAHHTARWPLNVLLTPQVQPFAAFGFLPPTSQDELPACTDVLKQIYQFYLDNKQKITAYHLPTTTIPDVDTHHLLEKLYASFDASNGGFGGAPKFPPYTTLLFLLHYFERTHDQNAYALLKKTLDVMALGGLYDHLQGGFFRYCLDEAWTTPHFEKTVYDQAMAIWVYSAAYKVLKVPLYKKVVEQCISCLEDSFEHDGLLYSSIAIGSNDQEQNSYLWSYAELEQQLSPDELAEFSRTYALQKEKNSNRRYHLIKTRDATLPAIEARLLALRKKRPQPYCNKMVITSWNALASIALIQAYRYADYPDAQEKAKKLFTTLLNKHTNNGMIGHSSFGGVVQQQEFLQDCASLLLAATYLYEDQLIAKSYLDALSTKLMGYDHQGIWYETTATDFMPTPAAIGDQVVPGSGALATYASLRTIFFNTGTLPAMGYKEPLLFDFLNISAFASTGNAHLMSILQPIVWKDLPFNCMQRQGPNWTDCFNQECKEYENREALINSVKN
jgi:uncharacterized protein YyaL (SSP411 family)